jgi:hypothetical protein
MMNRRAIIAFSLIIVASQILTGCNSLFNRNQDEVDIDALVQTSIAQTQSISAVPETVGESDLTEVPPAPTDEILATPTETLTPTLAPTPTETLTPTLSNPQVQVGVDTNCRVGPGDIYDIVGGLLVGETAQVVGQYLPGNYWIIDNPDGSGDCWIWGYYATLEGPVDDLPYFTQPPTPTPTVTPKPVVNWTGTWTSAYAEVGNPYVTFPISLTQSDSIVYGSFTYNTMYYSLTGSLSADLLTLSGYWDNGITTGPFLFHWLNANQFNGNAASDSIEWCGYRNGASIPSPCLYP